MSSRKMKYVDSSADDESENAVLANLHSPRFKRARTDDDMVVVDDSIDRAFERFDAAGKTLAGLAAETAETSRDVARLAMSLRATQKYTSKTMYRVAELYDRVVCAENAAEAISANNAALASRLDAAETRAAEADASLAQVRGVMSAYAEDTDLLLTYVFVACAVVASCIAMVIAIVKLQ
jgi:chromosome segregation ATPase